MKIKKRKNACVLEVYAAQNRGMREEQQDAYWIDRIADCYGPGDERDNCIAVIADGMGGYSSGRQAAYAAVRSFTQCFCSIADRCGSNINQAMIKAMLEANESVKKIKDSGATLLSAVVFGGNLYWLSIGDSRLYLYRNGLMRRINVEHNYETMLGITVDRYFDAKYGEKVNKGALTSHLGMERITEFDYNDCIYPLFAGDKLVLCSDGLYRAQSDAEMASLLGMSAGDPARLLVSNAVRKKRRGQDNITAVVISVVE